MAQRTSDNHSGNENLRATGEEQTVGMQAGAREAQSADRAFHQNASVTHANAGVQMLDLDSENAQSENAESDAGSFLLAQATPAQGAVAATGGAVTGKVLGTIQFVTGDVKIMGVDGVLRLAQVGDKVAFKETIVTGTDGLVQIRLDNGQLVDVGRDSKLALDTDFFGYDAGTGLHATAPTTVTGGIPPVAEPPSKPAAALSNEEIAARIARGEDPTQVAPATAAGGAPAAGGAGGDGSGGTPVLVDQANSTGPVTAGFDTGGGSITFPTPEFQLLPTQEQPTVSVSVQVTVDVQVAPGETPAQVDGSLGVGAANIIEGSGTGLKNVNFIITLDKVFSTDVTVTYQIVPGTAQAGSDFTTADGSLTGTVTILAGQTSFTVPVQIVQDTTIEGNETFSIVLTGATNATINPDADSAQATIVDDDLLASADTNWAKEDTNVTISGNVIAGAPHGGAPSGTFADVADADTASDAVGLTVTAVSFGAAAGTVGSVVHGAFGDLTLNANGTYTYVVNNSLPAVQRLDDGETLTDTFNYTDKNGFNNTSSSTLTITIFGTNDAPTITAQTTARVSEEGLPNANPDTTGSADTTNAASASGTIAVADTDIEPLTVTLSAPAGALTSGGTTISWTLSDGGHTLTGKAGASTIVTITIDDGGNYNVTLSGPVDHATAGVEDEKSFNVGVTVSDGTASASGTLTVTVEDDSPVISLSGLQAPALVVDETDLSTNASANFSGMFSSNAGADGQASLAYSLGISSNGVASGVTDTATGQSIVLTMNGGVVEGHVGTTGGALAFTVSVNGSTGVVTLDQIRAVVHPTASSPDTSEGVSLTSNAVMLTATVVDKDGDSANTSINLGNAISFLDDGPSITVTRTEASADALVVDETNLSVNATANFADNFGVSSSYGADGAGTTSSAYALSINAGSTGLVDTATNQAVTLAMNGGTVEGRVSNGEGGFFVVFTVSVDASGNVTLDQQRAVVHSPDTGPDQSTSLASANLIALTRTDTITDRDGDSANSSSSINIGTALNFEDDAPSITVSATQAADTLTVDETDLSVNATANFADNFTVSSSYGADGAGTTSSAYALSINAGATGLVDTATNQAVTLVMNGSTVEGHVSNGEGGFFVVFTVSVDASGNVTLDQQRAVVHSPDTGPDQSTSLAAANLVVLTRTDTITDKDGDTSTGSAHIDIGTALTFKDDAPSISASLATADSLQVDETVLATNATTSFAGLFTSGFGADGAGTLGYSLNVSAPGVDSGLDDTLTGQNVLLSMNGGVVEGRTAISNQLVFTVSVNSATGSVTLDQIRSVVHTPNTGPDQETSLAAANLITLTATITDKDGDSSSATADLGNAISFKDDAPAIIATTDLIYSNTSNDGAGPATGGTGVFDYNIGADGRTSYDATHSDFAPITLAGTVGTNAIVSPTVTWASESATSATFNVSFSYQADPSSSTLTAATGTLSFDKVNGTYTIELANPISSFSVFTTSHALGFQGYNEGTSTQDNSGPAQVTVAQLANNFFVQFTGDQETGGGHPVVLTAGTTNPGNTAYTNGELFFAADTEVTVSSVAAGVAGNTMQAGEVLDFDFFTFNPTGFSNTPADGRASGIFLKFDGIGSSEDMVIVLKLIDPDDNSTTTKAIVVDNADIYKFGDTLPAGYGITLDSNDGAVIIESNDYNAAGQNYQIYGAQVLVSTEGITGTGINLNSNGASTTTENFSTVADSGNNSGGTWDSDVIKIVDVGFVTSSTQTQTTNLNFVGVSVVDADGDATAVQNLNVTVVGGTTFTGTLNDETFQSSAADETMIGGGGNDIFHFTSMADAADTVTDFHVGNTTSDANADVLNIGDILPAATEGATLASQLSGYVTLDTVSSPGNTIVKVDADGGGNSYQTLVTLNGVTGVTLQQLLDNHQLVT